MMKTRAGQCAGLMSALLVAATPAAAASASDAAPTKANARRPVTFNIPAQPLPAALAQFSAQTGLEFSASTDLVEGKQGREVKGVLTTDEGLRTLLKGSGLEFTTSANGVVAIYEDARTTSLASADGRLRLARADEPGATTNGSAAASGFDDGSGPESSGSKAAGREDTEEVIVRGVRFYQPDTAQAALKSGAPLRETPVSVSVVTSEQIEARAADSLEQAFRYSAGIQSLSGGANRRAITGFVVRGFNITGSAPLYINGSKFPINSLSGAMEPYLYESVELLKGPASVLYGQTPPGGIINLNSKRSTPEPVRSVKLQVGSWDHRQFNADFGGPLTEDGSFGYRVTGLVREGNTMMKEVPDDRSVVSTALDWKPSDRTSLALLATYHRTDTAYDGGKPADGTVLPNPHGRISPELFVGEPDYNRSTPKGYTLGYLFSHRFNDTWQVRQNLLVFDYDVYMAGMGGGVMDTATRRRISRGPYLRSDSDKGWSVDTQLTAKWRPGRFEHSFLLGVDLTNRDFTRVQDNGTLTPLDAFNPVYGTPVVMNGRPTTELQDGPQRGVYLQDHIKFDERWIMLLGARWDDATIDYTNINFTGATSEIDAEASDVTKRFGLMYLPENGIAPYFSYAESFQPTFGADFHGSPFSPTQGVQYELGMKWESKQRNATLTLAAYDITQNNNTTPDVNNPGFSVQTGEVTSRGIEAEGRISFRDRLDVIAAYNHVDSAEVTESNGVDLGRKMFSLPDRTASLWLDYHQRVGAGELSLGAGVRYSGKSVNLLNTVTLPSYTDYDFSARYDTLQWRFALNVKNFTDVEYVAACVQTCFYGDTRNITFSTQYSW